VANESAEAEGAVNAPLTMSSLPDAVLCATFCPSTQDGYG